MDAITNLYLKFIVHFWDRTNIYRLVFFGVLALALIIISMFTYNHNVELLICILAGISMGLFLNGLQARRAWLKKSRQENAV